ncbi:MAG: hypothetical protein RL662_2294 [Bacteroidota bacterium]|jgi:SpoIID/LytB domain protein
MQNTEPNVYVGIMWGDCISFQFNTPYYLDGQEVQGHHHVKHVDGKISYANSLFDELVFEPVSADASFTLQDVTIGINFHWERKENQTFQGALKLVAANGQLTAINVVKVEDYLTSVISSEMSATASLELLKAHAVISRSWLLAQIEKNKDLVDQKIKYSTQQETDTELIKWYDREDHTLFDVCADDHCQRYQGVTRANSNIEIVKMAIRATRGQVMLYDQKICDARFSKCCGGAVEEFQNCWEDIKHPYLVKLRDDVDTSNLPDLTDESKSVDWILSRPSAFCNTQDAKILGQVLNNYDQETTDFYRWQVEYTQRQLSELVFERSGIDFGLIQEMIPMERGTSARLTKLKIIGSKKTLTIGKELEIRRILSKSHLYSSAFVIEKKANSFILRGAGWGHGVGLCQIGAAVMGEKGYVYDKILLHYYVDATIERLYN